MEKLINWRRGFFSSTYQFYSNGMQVGLLKIGTWSSSAKGVLNDKEFEFIKKGFFKQETTILDIATSQTIGMISFGQWRAKATITMVNGDVYKFEYSNFWQSKWNLSRNLQLVNYHGSRSKGEIVAYIPDEVVIIAGLYISNHFWQKRAAAAAAT